MGSNEEKTLLRKIIYTFKIIIANIAIFKLCNSLIKQLNKFYFAKILEILEIIKIKLGIINICYRVI